MPDNKRKISCGGFNIDGETLVEENGCLKIAGGGNLPSIEISDKDKYLHTNAITGNPEWVTIPQAAGGGF